MDPTASLDASVTLLLAHLDTPVLQTASASDRATAMSALLKAPAPAGAGSGSSSIGGTPASSGEGDTVMWARVFAQPVTVALFALLDALNVIPIVEYRLARLLLGDPSPIGNPFYRQRHQSSECAVPKYQSGGHLSCYSSSPPA